MQVMNVLFIYTEYRGIYVKMASKAFKIDTENLKCYITNILQIIYNNITNLSSFPLKIKKSYNGNIREKLVNSDSKY